VTGVNETTLSLDRFDDNPPLLSLYRLGVKLMKLSFPLTFMFIDIFSIGEGDEVLEFRLS
jgi:hypothetical protein